MSQFDSDSKDEPTLILSKPKTLMNVDLFLGLWNVRFPPRRSPARFALISFFWFAVFLIAVVQARSALNYKALDYKEKRIGITN